MKTEVQKDIESSHKNLDHTKEMIDGYDHIWKWNSSEEKNKSKYKWKQERNICNLWDRQELRALSIKGSYKFTCVPTCTHTHAHTQTAKLSQKHVSSPGGLDSKCARRQLCLKCLCSAHRTLHVVSTQVDSVHFSCLLQFQKCLHLFPLLALKNTLLTQKNLIKMLPMLFVTHSWKMAPAVLISARSLLQA